MDLERELFHAGKNVTIVERGLETLPLTVLNVNLHEVDDRLK
jgi:hypothetical protein